MYFFRLANLGIRLVSRVKQGGLRWSGICCSSWVLAPLSVTSLGPNLCAKACALELRSVLPKHLRKRNKDIAGDISRACVRAGNAMAASGFIIGCILISLQCVAMSCSTVFSVLGSGLRG